jgi:hypothetical protein
MDWKETLGIGVNIGASPRLALNLWWKKKRKGIVVMQAKGG